MQVLYTRLGSNIPIWCISHAGHDVKIDPPLVGNEDLYSYEGQIKHKIAFIEETLNPGSEVTFVGHSVGSKISLEVMKRCEGRIDLKTRGYMLFPMMERMAETPGGKFTKIQVKTNNICTIRSLSNAFSDVVLYVVNLFDWGNAESSTGQIQEILRLALCRFHRSTLRRCHGGLS